VDHPTADTIPNSIGIDQADVSRGARMMASSGSGVATVRSERGVRSRTD